MKNKGQLCRQLNQEVILSKFETTLKKWIETKTIKANVEDMIKNRYQLSENIINFSSAIPKNYYIITIRHQNDITTEDRIKFKDKTYLILKIINHNERNRILQLLVSEV